MELVPVPVRDIDAAKAFYADKVGFNVDLDVKHLEEMRVVQLTPPSSTCSIVLGAGMPMIGREPGSVRGLHLVVRDVAEARSMLTSRGVAVDDSRSITMLARPRVSVS